MVRTFEIDKETIKLMRMFKNVRTKQEIADSLAKETVAKGIKDKSQVFEYYYGDIEPEFVIMSCISFGLMQFMSEDFYVVKEVLGFDYVYDILNKSEKCMKLIS
ncbi:hypothetical protein [Clostridium tyrobutyricum]|uniref:hypothetical protein n=2 Tax=Clostridium TaxID=1485 RepID=UPI002430E4D1|nr:hypothetical protein [Clostridium tyrobutyricum]